MKRMSRRQYERAIIRLCMAHYCRIAGLVISFVLFLVGFFWALDRLGLLEILNKTPWWFYLILAVFLFIAVEVSLLLQYKDPWIKWHLFYPGLSNLGYKPRHHKDEDEIDK